MPRMQRPAELTAPGLSFPHTHTTKIEQCHSAGRRHAHAPRFRSANVSCLARARCKGVAPWMSARDLIEVVRVAVIVVHDQGRPSVRGGHPPSRVGLTASSLSRPLCRLPKGPLQAARFARSWYVSETLWYQNFKNEGKKMKERKLGSCTRDEAVFNGRAVGERACLTRMCWGGAAEKNGPRRACACG